MRATTHLVQAAYNAMAFSYSDYRKHLGSISYLQKFIHCLPSRASVLDIGCGNGRPIDEALVKAGCLVTGVDVSASQIALAKRNVPTGEYIIADMEALAPAQFAVDGIVCYYALFHVPREKHATMLKLMASFLPLGGWLLITMGDCDFEGMHELCGEQVWSSHYNPTHNRQLLNRAGFIILTDEIDRVGGEKHQVLLCQKS